jgi:hypothetical protein
MFDDEVTIIDNVLSIEDCDSLIAYYTSCLLETDHGYNYPFKAIVPHYTRKPVDDFIREKVSLIMKHVPENLMVQRAHIECRQNEHMAHRDMQAGEWGLCTSVLYLNDNFDGGQTFITKSTGERVEVQPKPGRVVAYNGHKLEHGVTQVSNGLRYTLPIWYTIRPQDLPKSLLWWL